MQIEELDAALQIIKSLSKGGQKFMEICDKIRVTVTPTNTFPGIMEKFNTPTLVTIIQLLQDFSQIIIENNKKYSTHHYSRSIDSSNNAALGCSILFIRTKIPDWFMECEKYIKQSIDICKSFVPNDLQFSASVIFNIGSYLFAAKEYSCAYRLFKLANSIAIEISTKNIQKLYIKSYRYIALCLIALDRTDTDEFDTAAMESNCDYSVIHSLICWRPPSNPEVVANYLKINLQAKGININPNFAQIDLNNPKIIELNAYFALHGYKKMIPQNSEFASLFPNLKTPTRLHLKSTKLEQTFYLCHTYYASAKFLECNKETIELLKAFPTEKLTPTSYIALFFIYYWIIETFIALDRNNEARWYAKEMRKLFVHYPFTVGFAAFLELKSRIHIAKMTQMKPFPSLQFASSFNWESVRELEIAVICANHNNEQCFLHFENTMAAGNPIVINEAFHIYINTSRMFGICPNLEEFRSISNINRASSALFIYHQIVQILMSEDIDEFWNPQYYINNKQIKETNSEMEMDDESILERIKKIQNSLFMDLKKAEKLATGYSIIMRQILQLEALITGTVDSVNTAFLLTTSLSQSLDRYIPSTKQKKFLIPFPILSIAYFDVPGLERCLLFALYHPNSKPIVIRIKCHDALDRCLSTINDIEIASTNVSPSLSPAEWWSQKKILDDELGSAINEIETILGPWCGLLAPMIFKPHHSLAVNTLITSLLYRCDLNDEIIEIMRQMRLQTIHRASLSPVKSDSEFNMSNENENDLAPKAKQTINIDRTIYTYTCIQKFPLALILGKTVHKIPWESLPIVLKNEIAITRIPSLRLIALHCQEDTLPVNVDPKKAFFVLNPQGDLVTTQMTFNEVFVKEFSWEGVTGIAPTGNEVLNAIEKYDLFVYCGHGSGKEYFNYSDIIDKNLKCKSSMFLMGCRSCELQDEGDSDPRGIAMNLILGGSGSVVGNLWNVTDRDIDRFLLDLLLRAVENGPFELEKAVLHARSACKLKYLTGAAPIIYGFPTYFNNDQMDNTEISIFSKK